VCKSGIYCIINLVNKKIYIGSAIDFNRRKGVHLSKLKLNKHDNPHLQRAYNKYGYNKFIFEIIEYIEQRESISNIKDFEAILLKREDYWISFYRKTIGKENVYNIREHANSNLGYIFSEESKKEISKNHVGMLGKKHSGETKQEMSKNRGGENNPFFGKKHSEESRRKMVKARVGRKVSNETIQKMIIAHSGKNNPNIIDKEIILQIRNMLNKGVLQKDICKILNVSESTVYKVKNGGYKNAYGI
jgi:group I intron endonuclease